MSGTRLGLPFKHFVLATETPIKLRKVILNLEIKGQRSKEALRYFPRPWCLSAHVGTAIRVFQVPEHPTTEAFILVKRSVKMLSHAEDAGCNSSSHVTYIFFHSSVQPGYADYPFAPWSAQCDTTSSQTSVHVQAKEPASGFSCVLTLCNLMDCSPPGSSVHGISQARILEWVAISFSRGSSRPRDWAHVSSSPCIGRRIL